MDSQQVAIGKQVRAARKARGWTAARLAQEARIAPNTVGSIERGEGYQDGKLAAVLKALDFTPQLSIGTDYPDDVEEARTWLSAHLVAMSPEHRRDTVDALIHFLIERASSERTIREDE